ncbi:class I adenylate-forming enzyme family protein [Cohnella sp. AR92]|uniref:class I adenylate-forming enzyme family protein n=1 Tax=Cohnella sp. AR92 TaxID=648716 RepID=UPI000F8D9B3B|nr:class I adenylate-forming enzyme family protein [Cohnella sp. AR92]RUS45733.1 long-chain fatty acid--CoA ligase [Cohnella sp. AR92]
MDSAQSALSVPQLLERAALSRRDQEAIYDLTRRMTYGELQTEVAELSSALVTFGVKPGDRVAVALPNWHETVELFFAVAQIGAILVPFNPKYRLHEVRHILMNSGAEVIFVCDEFENVGLEQIPPTIRVVTVRYRKEGALSLEQLRMLAGQSALPQIAADPNEDVFCILYTSGTTGTPKGAMLTHRSIVQSAITIGVGLQSTSDDVMMILSPIYHVFGMSVNLMSSIYYRMRAVLVPKFKPADALRLIEQERVTIHHAVPAILNIELKDENFESFDLSSLRVGITGAASCPPDTIRGVRQRMGMRLCISFGATETGSVTTTGYDDPESKIMDSVGKPLPGTEVRIVDGDRRTLPFGETGEIAVKGFGVLKGYYGMPIPTREVLDEDGWYYTGDLGTMGSDGYICYLGRKKELINRGGFNIYPQEIEGLLQNHPKVLESAVVGIPDKILGEVVCAAVKLRPHLEATQEEIIEYLKSFIAGYKLPGHIVFVSELPATASGKILKTKLKEEILEQLNAG